MHIKGSARVSDDAKVFDNATVDDNAWVFGNAQVSGDAQVYDDARVFGNARVYGDAKVSGGFVGNGADVFARHHVQTYEGSDNVTYTVYRRRNKKPRIMSDYSPIKYSKAPPVVRAIAEAMKEED